MRSFPINWDIFKLNHRLQSLVALAKILANEKHIVSGSIIFVSLEKFNALNIDDKKALFHIDSGLISTETKGKTRPSEIISENPVISIRNNISFS